jgi:hypothetical protein
VKAAAHIFRIDIEGFTDVVKREEPEPVLAIDPIFSLAESVLAAFDGGLQIPALTLDSIFKDREHQCLFCFEQMLATESLVVLKRQHHLGFENGRTFLMCNLACAS